MSHISHDALRNKIQQASSQVVIGRQYIHYKYPDRRYKVLNIGVQEASEKICVMYCDTNSPDIIFVRDLDSWLETIDGVPRFVLSSM